MATRQPHPPGGGLAVGAPEADVAPQATSQEDTEEATPRVQLATRRAAAGRAHTLGVTSRTKIPSNITRVV
jgi:hypothetical protein